MRQLLSYRLRGDELQNSRKKESTTMKLEAKLEELNDHKLFGSSDLTPQVVPYLTQKIIVRVIKSFMWGRPLRSSCPTVNLTLQAFIQRFLRQERVLFLKSSF